MPSVLKSAWLLSAALALPLSAHASTPQAKHALDIAEQFMSFQGSPTTEQINQLVRDAIYSNIRIEPEYVAVAFYNEQTGERLPRQQVRELIGPVRQDGSMQLIALAVAMAGDQLAFDEEQLNALLDASFLASMRNPPAHIGVEFYDRRQGPTGRSGGVSGSVPEKTYAEPTAPPAPSTTHPDVPSFDDYGPDSLDALLNFFAAHNLLVEKRTDQIAIPMLVGAYASQDIEQLFNDEIKLFATEFGLKAEEVANRYNDQTDNGIHRQAGIVFFSGTEAALELLRADLGDRLYRSD